MSLLTEKKNIEQSNRFRSISQQENTRIHISSLLVGSLLHIIPLFSLYYFLISPDSSSKNSDELAFSGGGGGGETKEFMIEFGENTLHQENSIEPITSSTRFTFLNISILADEAKKPSVKKEIKPIEKPQKALTKNPAYVPTRRIRGVGPGGGGGTGGGIGKSSGFSIDWEEMGRPLIERQDSKIPRRN